MRFFAISQSHADGPIEVQDDYRSFDTARLAWADLRARREEHEDQFPDWGVGEYSETVRYLDYAATECEFGNLCEDWPLAADGTGVITGATPGLGDGPLDATVNDPGMVYAVVAR